MYLLLCRFIVIVVGLHQVSKSAPIKIISCGKAKANNKQQRLWLLWTLDSAWLPQQQLKDDHIAQEMTRQGRKEKKPKPNERRRNKAELKAAAGPSGRIQSVVCGVRSGGYGAGQGQPPVVIVSWICPPFATLSVMRFDI